MIVEVNVPRPSSIVRHKLLVALGSLVPAIPRQHALQGHADALHVLDWGPALGAEEIQTDYAVAVDVWVHGDWSVGEQDEGYFWGFCGKAVRSGGKRDELRDRTLKNEHGRRRTGRGGKYQLGSES